MLDCQAKLFRVFLGLSVGTLGSQAGLLDLLFASRQASAQTAHVLLRDMSTHSESGLFVLIFYLLLCDTSTHS